MLFFGLNEEGKAMRAFTIAQLKDAVPCPYKVVYRQEFHTMAHAEKVAGDLGPDYVAVDAGEDTWPRYDVIERPKVGDRVSRYFNGDYYPAGSITHVTPKSARVVKTDDGTTFYRRGCSDNWKSSGTWSMVKGWSNEKNPCF